MKDKLSNRIEAINMVHSFLNEKLPALREYVEKNGYKVKAGSTELFKKDKDALQSIIGECPERISAWLSVGVYDGVRFTAKIAYAIDGDLERKGNWGAAYYERTGYLTGVTNPEPFPIYDLAEWREKAALVQPMRDKISELESELRAITYITEGR